MSERAPASGAAGTTPPPGGGSPTASSHRSARITLLVLLAMALVLMSLLFAPFSTPLYLAAVIAGVLHPAIAPISRRLHVRPPFAAALLAFGVLVAVVLPLGWLGVLFVRQGVHAVVAARDLLATNSVDELLAKLPPSLQGLAATIRPSIEDALPDLRDAIAPVLQSVLQRLPGWLARTGGFLGEAVLMIVALYALLADGARLVRWLGQVVPLPQETFDRLLEDLRRTASAVFTSTLLIAAVQALATLIGLTIVGAQQPVFLAFVAFFIALIPVLSPGLVSFGVAVVLFAQGRWVAALILSVWTLGVVMTVDNLLRPMLLQRGIGLHPTVLLFAILGGVVAFGPIGVVAGPMVLSFFIAVVDMCREEFVPAESPAEASGGPAKTGGS